MVGSSFNYNLESCLVYLIQQNVNFVELPKDEYPYEIPNNWKITNIQNVCNLYTGNSIPENLKISKYSKIQSGFDYIGTKDVTFENTIVYNNGIKFPLKKEILNTLIAIQ